jgi:hypothetical protein
MGSNFAIVISLHTRPRRQATGLPIVLGAVDWSNIGRQTCRHILGHGNTLPLEDFANLETIQPPRYQRTRRRMRKRHLGLIPGHETTQSVFIVTREYLGASGIPLLHLVPLSHAHLLVPLCQYQGHEDFHFLCAAVDTLGIGIKQVDTFGFQVEQLILLVTVRPRHGDTGMPLPLQDDLLFGRQRQGPGRGRGRAQRNV